MATRLIVDGCVVIPDVVTGDALEGMSAGFERRAGELDKRWMDWDEISVVPELMTFIGHPKLMEVLDIYYAHFGHTAAFACCSGARDIFDPSKEPSDADFSDLTKAPVGWHDDVTGMKDPLSTFLESTVTTLIYLDDTFADNGAYCTALGSHHLVRPDENDHPILADSSNVLNHCELRALGVKAGSVIAHRAHGYHGVVRALQRRRVMLQCFAGREVYDLQKGHTQVSEEARALIPKEQQKYLCYYKNS